MLTGTNYANEPHPLAITALPCLVMCGRYIAACTQPSQHFRFFIMFCSMFCSPTLLVFYLLLGTGTTGEDCFSINSCGEDPVNLPLDTLISYSKLLVLLVLLLLLLTMCY